MDLYLIHWPYEFGKPGYPTHEEGWKVLEELKDEGLVKCVFRCFLNLPSSRACSDLSASPTTAFPTSRKRLLSPGTVLPSTKSSFILTSSRRTHLCSLTVRPFSFLCAQN